jgi:FG-GAP repeat protein
MSTLGHVWSTAVFALAATLAIGEESGAQCVPSETLVPPGGYTYRYGWSSATTGDTVVVGSWGGGANVFDRTPTGWQWTQLLLPSDDLIRYFGYAVAMDGDHLLVGDPGWGGLGENRYLGAVWAYERIGGTWVEVARLLASDGASPEGFGASLAVNGDRAVVGSPRCTDAVIRAGAVYVFDWADGAWTETAKLRASSEWNLGEFGTEVDIDGDTLVASARGGADAVVFERNPTWQETAWLAGSPGVSALGGSISIGGGRIVCSPRSRIDSTSIAVFEKVGGVWSQVARFSPPNIGDEDEVVWGHSAMDGDRIALGFWNRPIRDAGCWIFEWNGSSWIDTGRTSVPSGGAVAGWGIDVSLSNRTLVVGGDNNQPGSSVERVHDLPSAFEVRTGNVNASAGPVADVVFVGDSSGSTSSERRVEIDRIAPFTLRVASPPSMPLGARFVLYAWRGTPQLQHCEVLPDGIGSIAFPTPMSGSLPRPERIANNMGEPERYGAEVWPASPTSAAPTILLSRPLAHERAGTFYLQGLIEDASAPNAQIAVTNGILLVVR